MDWTTEDVAGWLKSISMEETTVDKFVRQKISGAALTMYANDKEYPMNQKTKEELGLEITGDYMTFIVQLKQIINHQEPEQEYYDESGDQIMEKQIQGMAMTNAYNCVNTTLTNEYNAELRRRKNTHIPLIRPDDPNDSHSMAQFIDSWATVINQATNFEFCRNYIKEEDVELPKSDSDPYYANTNNLKYCSTRIAGFLRQMTELTFKTETHGRYLQDRLRPAANDGAKCWYIIWESIYVGMNPVSRYGPTFLHAWLSPEQSSNASPEQISHTRGKNLCRFLYNINTMEEDEAVRPALETVQKTDNEQITIKRQNLNELLAYISIHGMLKHDNYNVRTKARRLLTDHAGGKLAVGPGETKWSDGISALQSEYDHIISEPAVQRTGHHRTGHHRTGHSLTRDGRTERPHRERKNRHRKPREDHENTGQRRTENEHRMTLVDQYKQAKAAEENVILKKTRIPPHQRTVKTFHQENDHAALKEI